jgi:hypothetical protein
MVVRFVLMAALLACPPLAAAQDSARLARLEQELHQLQQELTSLSQLVTELRLRAERPTAPATPLLAPPAAPGRSGPATESAARA